MNSIIKRLEEKYAVVEETDTGYFNVSTIDPESIPLAYHHDLHGLQGCWGLVDKDGNEIISPKYLFPLFQCARDRFEACKGSGWEIDEERTAFENETVYWAKEEKWGVIDINENEIIPCVYDQISGLTGCAETKEITHIPVYRHQYEPYDIQEVAVFDSNGNEIIPFIYNDVYWYEENDQLIVYLDCIRGDDDAKVGVYDFKLNKEIIKPKYKSIEYVDYNLFLISDDVDNGIFATIINEKEEVIGEEKIWRYISTLGKNGRKYEGEKMNGEKVYFNIKDGKIVDVIGE